jgi:hypothetical protein
MATFSGGSNGKFRIANGATRKMALPLILGQLVPVMLILLPYIVSDGAWPHFIVLAVNTALAIWFSVRILQHWKSENDNPDGPSPPPWMLGPLFIGLTVVVISGAACYVRFYYANKFTEESIIEGLNYSVQTVTTVGYGNWPLTDVKPTLEQFRNLRICTIFLMPVGASLFAMTIGMVTTWLQSLKPKPPHN